MKIFFSGGTGFFGKAVLRYLMTQYASQQPNLPDEVVVLSRSPEKFLQRYPVFSQLPWLRFHQGDIERPVSLPRQEKFTHVLHAATDSTDASQLSYLQRNDQIVEGTKNILQFAVETGAQRFLLTSSGGVYGPQPQHLDAIPESYDGMPDPLNVNNVYGVAKRHAEHLCALYGQQYGIEPVVARCFAFVGEDLPMDAHFAIGNFIRDALCNAEITVGGDGTPVRSYLYQAELAQWLLTLLRDGRAGEAYNVGSAETVTIAELAYLVRDLLAPGKPVKILAQAAAGKALRNRYVPDITKAQRELGLSSRIALKDAIMRTAQEFKRA